MINSQLLTLTVAALIIVARQDPAGPKVDHYPKSCRIDNGAYAAWTDKLVVGREVRLYSGGEENYDAATDEATDTCRTNDSDAFWHLGSRGHGRNFETLDTDVCHRGRACLIRVGETIDQRATKEDLYA